MIFPGRDIKFHFPVNLQVCLSSFLKGRTGVSLFPFTRNFILQSQLFSYDNEWFGNHTSQFPQGTEMHAVQTNGFVHTQSLEEVSELLFSYSRRDICKLSLARNGPDNVAGWWFLIIGGPLNFMRLP